MFKAVQMAHAARARMEMLNLLIEPTREEAEELAALTKQFNRQRQAAMDANDPDPDGRAARQYGIFTEMYDEAQRRDERNCALAQRRYNDLFKSMNKNGTLT